MFLVTQEPRMREDDDQGDGLDMQNEQEHVGGPDTIVNRRHAASNASEVDKASNSLPYRTILEKAWRTGISSVALPTNLIMLYQLTTCDCPSFNIPQIMGTNRTRVYVKGRSL
jgi:hypothetical protein